MEEFDKIKSLLVAHNIEEVCNALKKYPLSEKTINDIFLQEARYYHLRREINNGLIEGDQASKERNKVIDSLLQIIGIVKKEMTNEDQFKKANGLINTEGETKLSPEVENLNALHDEGCEYLDNAIRYIGSNNKRITYNRCDNASINFKILTIKSPNKPVYFLGLATALKILYLLNYNGSRTIEKFREITLNIENGKNVDTNKIFHNRFDLILFDIGEYIKKKKLAKVLFIVSIIGLTPITFDQAILKLNSYEEGSLGQYAIFVFVFILISAFYFEDSAKKHLSGE